jgi:hypothetical protein
VVHYVATDVSCKVKLFIVFVQSLGSVSFVSPILL